MHHKAQQEHLIYNSQGFMLLKRVQGSKQRATQHGCSVLCPVAVVQGTATKAAPADGASSRESTEQGATSKVRHPTSCNKNRFLFKSAKERKESQILLPALTRLGYPMPQFPTWKTAWALSSSGLFLKIQEKNTALMHRKTPSI